MPKVVDILDFKSVVSLAEKKILQRLGNTDNDPTVVEIIARIPMEANLTKTQFLFDEELKKLQNDYKGKTISGLLVYERKDFLRGKQPVVINAKIKFGRMIAIDCTNKIPYLLESI